MGKINLSGAGNGVNSGLADVGLTPPAPRHITVECTSPASGRITEGGRPLPISDLEAILSGAERDVHVSIQRRNKAARELYDARRAEAGASADDDDAPSVFVCAPDAPHAANSRVTELIDDLTLCDDDVRERFVDWLCAGLGMGNYADDAADITELGMSIRAAGSDARATLMISLLAARREYLGLPAQASPIADRDVLDGYKEPRGGGY